MKFRFGLGAAVSILLLCGACRDEREAVGTDLPSLEVKAIVDRPRTALVSAPFEARVQSIAVPEGTSVKAGDVVATLTNPAVARDLAWARTQLAIAERRVAAAGRASAPRADDGERLRAAESLLRMRKARLDRYRKLFATHDVAAQDVENAEAEYVAATREVAAERAALTQSLPTADPALLQLELEKARAELTLVTERQQQLVLKAPIAGVVTRVPVSPGDAVYTRDPLLEIANASTLDVRGSIAPELLRYVRAGMPVGVKVFTVPPRRFTANIRTIVPPTDPAGATIVVSVPNPDGVLQPGTAATITVR